MPRKITDAEAHQWLIASTHEGAHAAACLEFGIPMEYASIEQRHHWFSSPGWVGGVYIPPIRAGDRVGHDDFALMCLAGPEAQARVEHRIFGGPLDRVRRRVYAENTRGRDADMVSVTEVIADCSFSLRRAQRLVRDLVDDLWPSVESIAAALRKDGYLTAKQIRRVA